MTLDKLCGEITSYPNIKKIVSYGEKRTSDGEIREVSLLIVTDSDPRSLEKELYRGLEPDFAVNLLVYKEEDFSALLSDRTSYAYSILKKGTVIYG